MEALALTREGYVIVKVDCKAGYYQVPVSPTDQPFLGLAVEVDAEGTVEYFTFARLLLLLLHLKPSAPDRVLPSSCFRVRVLRLMSTPASP